MTVNDERTETTKIFLNAYLQAEIIKGLKYKLNVGIRKSILSGVITRMYTI